MASSIVNPESPSASTLINPYIITYLNTTVRILPQQMDNNIRKYIKTNLDKEHINKCFLDYGYITKIQEILPEYDADVVAEDPIACGLFKVKFLCTLCRPLLNSTIIARIQAVTAPIIYLVNGPIDIIIKTSHNINKNSFVFNQKHNKWTVKKEGEEQNKYIVIIPGQFMKVKILSKMIINKSEKIFCIGYLENIAQENEIKESMYQEKNIEKQTSIQEYLNLDKDIQKKEEEKILNQSLISDVSDLTEEED